jgi:hypothetical protein
VLRQEPVGARAERPNPRRFVAARRDDDDGQAPQPVLPAHELDHLDAADVRHVEIEHEEVEFLEGKLLDGLEPARGVAKGELGLGAETRDDHVAHHLAVVDDEYLLHAGINQPCG